MLSSTLKYLCSIESVRMHFPAKQPCTNDTMCSAACSIAHSIICTRLSSPILVTMSTTLFPCSTSLSRGTNFEAFHWQLSICVQEYCVEPTVQILTLLWPAGHTCPTYKEALQVRWDNSIPLFLHAVIYLEVSLFHWTSQNAFSRETSVYKWYCCAMLHSSIAHSIICTRENAFWLVQRNRDTSR